MKGSLASRLMVALVVLAPVACVTETVEREPGIKVGEAATVSVQDSSASIAPGSTFAWHPEAIRFYEDARLKDAHLRKHIEEQIVVNLVDKQMVMVESISGSRYSIAYTAALSSSLGDDEIIQRFGLLPGNQQIPEHDRNIEKGSLIIYVFDNRTASVLWRSATQAGVTFDLTEEERSERIAAVVKAMFQTLPVADGG